MWYRSIMALLLAGAAAAIPQAATAQELRDLDGEESTVRGFPGRITDGPQRFTVSVPADSAMQIDVISTSDLDPILRVFDAVTEELLAEDDDGGDELNSRATIRGNTGREAGRQAGRRIVIEVDTYSYEGYDDEESLAAGGSFDLRLTTRTYTAEPERQIGWGATETGSLLGGEEHRFRFSGEAGMLLEVAMLAAEEGSDLDPYLELRDAAGATVASNDDGGNGLDAVLRHVLDSDEDYTVVASAFGQSAGPYTLRVGERREPLVQAPEQMIGLGETATGRLGTGYENGGVEPATISYRLDEAARAAIAGGAGEITFRMAVATETDSAFGGALDPFLELGFDTPLGFAVVASDDDGAGERDALLPVDLAPVAADPALLERLRVRVSGFGETTGAYTLRLVPGIEAAAASGEAVEQ